MSDLMQQILQEFDSSFVHFLGDPTNHESMEIKEFIRKSCIRYAQGIVPEENIRNSRGSEEIAENYLRKAYDHGRQEERTAIVQNMFAKIQEDTIPTS